ncbi:GNAT family N-acetyltransferase [Ferrimonas balearica]|uniref:GNAT family N-acetyltransferase n=1 Tax=Ferrimonas balearica TaxID=44012 RepID=UPI001C99E52E|nr:GNAT family N-acetyltransferase [Ferrimonas balearica]MBY5993169.1 GNAT family N-acetyltransferase [Ferrimonas balearica]
MSSAYLGAGTLNAQLSERLARQERLRYRRAGKADIPAMTRIRLAVTENRLSDPGKITPQMYHDYLDRLGRGWVALLGDQVVGFAYADRPNAGVWALFVDPAYQGLGAGKVLLKMTVQWLFAEGAETVRLTTEVGTRAEGFYRAQGWQPGPVDAQGERSFLLRR